MSRGHKSSRVTAVAGAVLIGAATFVVTAAAQNSGRKPILHEDLTPPADGERTSRKVRSDQQVFGSDPAVGQNPSAIEANSKIIPEPPTTEERKDSELVHGGRGPQKADRFTEYRPDLHTGTDGTLHYVEVFNPGIIPFKRMTALDAVQPDYTLTTFYDSNSTDPIPVGGKPTENDELFWGSVVVELRQDELVPLPSVSPDMRILSYEVTPSIPLTFAKDDADNFYVGSDEAGLSGKQYRLVFSVAVNRNYFRPRIPDGVQVRQLGEKPRKMPPSVKQAGLKAAASLGVYPRTDLKEALDRLVNYHRQFEAKESPTSTGDIFESLFRQKAGVCRHRSFTFMVTANAVGIPTRYVANEAHAWVEVWIPGNNWVRIDLGGAAMTLQVSNAEGKTMRAADPDPFPQPKEYNENYTQLEGDVQGLTGEQIAEAQTPPNNGSGSGGGEGEGLGEGEGSGGAFYEGDEAEGPSGTGHMTGPGQGLPEIPPEELVGKMPVTISVGSASDTGFRGESITVTGAVVDDDGDGVAKQRVDIFLAPEGLGGDEYVLVGHTITTDDGRWTAAVNLPRELDLRKYEVFASTPGDDKYQPSLSK